MINATTEELVAELVRRRRARMDVLRTKIKRREAQVAQFRRELRALECEMVDVTRSKRAAPTAEEDVARVLHLVCFAPGARLGSTALLENLTKCQVRRIFKILEQRGQIRREGSGTFTRYFPI